MGSRCRLPLIQPRLEGLPKAVRDIAWKAQTRLCGRYRRLSAAGKKLPVTIAAIAREMAAFLWATGQRFCQISGQLAESAPSG